MDGLGPLFGFPLHCFIHALKERGAPCARAQTRGQKAATCVMLYKVYRADAPLRSYAFQKLNTNFVAEAHTRARLITITIIATASTRDGVDKAQSKWGKNWKGRI